MVQTLNRTCPLFHTTSQPFQHRMRSRNHFKGSSFHQDFLPLVKERLPCRSSPLTILGAREPAGAAAGAGGAAQPPQPGLSPSLPGLCNSSRALNEH